MDDAVQRRTTRNAVPGTGTTGTAGKQHEWIVASVLAVCLLGVAFWQVMAARSRGTLRPLDITAEDFAGFDPRVEEWALKPRAIRPDPIEPNMLAFSVLPAAAGVHPATRMLARLVHGYNMSDCMKIKGYRVELIADTRPSAASPAQMAGMAHQLWRLTSEVGDVSIWATSMLTAGTLAVTDVDCRSMAFPRVAFSEDANWVPRGLTWSSLRHPGRNFAKFIRSRWNASRSDLATFLRLKQPAWASEELLTLVTASAGAPVKPGDEAAVIRQVRLVHAALHEQLSTWREAQLAVGPGSDGR